MQEEFGSADGQILSGALTLLTPHAELVSASRCNYEILKQVQDEGIKIETSSA